MKKIMIRDQGNDLSVGIGSLILVHDLYNRFL